MAATMGSNMAPVHVHSSSVVNRSKPKIFLLELYMYLMYPIEYTSKTKDEGSVYAYYNLEALCSGIHKTVE